MTHEHDFKRFPELTDRQMEIHYFESPTKQIFEDLRAKVVNVHDGDSIRVEWLERDFDFPIRFARIEAPELDASGGKESQEWLESQILKEDVDILINKDNRVDKWGRILGEVIHRGINLNEQSMSLGHSVLFEDKPQESEWVIQ